MAMEVNSLNKSHDSDQAWRINARNYFTYRKDIIPTRKRPIGKAQPPASNKKSNGLARMNPRPITPSSHMVGKFGRPLIKGDISRLETGEEKSAKYTNSQNRQIAEILAKEPRLQDNCLTYLQK